MSLAALVLWPVRADAQAAGEADDDVQVLLTTAEALREIFPDAAGVVEQHWRPTAAERSALAERLGRGLYEPDYRFLLVYDRSRRFLGYALVTEERGKYRPITFMVGVTPAQAVKDAAVMVYRESRGGEVRRKRFLVQYRGKTLDDPIRINRDIINVSGATISVRSMNAGVRKVLALVAAAFAGGAPAAPAELQPVENVR
ncbi:MAG TPA: FMN-binding protein [Longimicrobiales bacterium]